MTTQTYVSTDRVLTKEDIKELRKSETVCIDLYESGGKVISQVRAIRDIPIKGVDSKYHHTHEIEVNAKLKIYRGNKTVYEPRADCYVYISRYSFRPEAIDYVIKSIREGDSLMVEWIGSGGAPEPGEVPSNYINGARTTIDGLCYNAPLHYDQVRLSIMRNGKMHSGATVATSVCPNNSARMIREV